MKKFLITAGMVSGLLALLPAAMATDISGKIILKGTPPKEKEIPQVKDDPNCGKLQTSIPTTHHYVVGAGGELANVVVSLSGPNTGGSKGASAEPVVLDQKNCEYSPVIFAVQTGQKIMVKNSDPVLHNVHAVPSPTSGNKDDNKAQMPGSGDLTFVFSKPESFLKFQCDVHTWMFAWVSIFDHPYFSVSAKDGTYKIVNVPPGKYTLTAMHRKAGTVTRELDIKEGESAKVDLTMDAK